MLVNKWFLGLDRPIDDQAYQYVSGSLYQNGVAATDVAQGDTGDCYLMASLAAIAKTSPATIQNMIHDNGDGTFTVRFYNKVADYVTVDRYFPVFSNGLAENARFGVNGPRRRPTNCGSPSSKRPTPKSTRKTLSDRKGTIPTPESTADTPPMSCRKSPVKPRPWWASTVVPITATATNEWLDNKVTGTARRLPTRTSHHVRYDHARRRQCRRIALLRPARLQHRHENVPALQSLGIYRHERDEARIRQRHLGSDPHGFYELGYGLERLVGRASQPVAMHRTGWEARPTQIERPDDSLLFPKRLNYQNRADDDQPRVDVAKKAVAAQPTVERAADHDRQQRRG